MSDKLETDRWYWDRRTRKALYPRHTDDDTVEFVTVWHAEEVRGAIEGGALVSLDEVGLDRTETTFDLIDSFRTPETIAEDAGSETDSSESDD